MDLLLAHFSINKIKKDVAFMETSFFYFVILVNLVSISLKVYSEKIYA